MKLSQTRLREIIQEEISKLNEAESVLSHAELKNKFFDMARKVSDLASNELDEQTRLVRVLLLAFATNVNTSDVKVALDMLERKLKSNDEYAKYLQAAPGGGEDEGAPSEGSPEERRRRMAKAAGAVTRTLARAQRTGPRGNPPTQRQTRPGVSHVTAGGKSFVDK